MKLESKNDRLVEATTLSVLFTIQTADVISAAVSLIITAAAVDNIVDIYTVLDDVRC